MKKVALAALIALILLIPTSAGFAEREDLPRLIDYEAEE